MPTKYVAIGVVVAIAAAAVYAYMSFSPGNANAPENTTSEESTASDSASTESENITGSIGDLLSRIGSWRCTFESSTDVANSSGEVLVSNQRLRGNFMSEVTVVNQTVESHMIQDDGYVYVWTSLSPQGYKTKTASGTADGSTQFSGQGVDIHQQYSYNCLPWTVDESVFTLPSGVTFIE